MHILNSDIGLWRDPLDNAGKSLKIDVAMGRYIIGNERGALPLSSRVEGPLYPDAFVQLN